MPWCWRGSCSNWRVLQGHQSNKSVNGKVDHITLKSCWLPEETEVRKREKAAKEKIFRFQESCQVAFTGVGQLANRSELSHSTIVGRSFTWLDFHFCETCVPPNILHIWVLWSPQTSTLNLNHKILENVANDVILQNANLKRFCENKTSVHCWWGFALWDLIFLKVL